jgi:hypothetical protein
MPRKQIVFVSLVVIVASASYMLFSAASQNSAGPVSPELIATAIPTLPTISPPTPDSRLTPTPLPLPVFTPFGTPLPTPILDPTWTPTPIVPTPIWTPIPPVLTSWTTFTGKSGFSFSYPAGWLAVEEYNPLAFQPLSISVINYRGPLPRNTTVIPGGVSIYLQSIHPQAQIPKEGSPLAVGSQKFTGYQFVYGRDNPPPDAPWFWVLERGIQVYFTAGNQQWSIAASFYPPKEGVEQYTQIFYHVVGSLNYAPK